MTNGRHWYSNATVMGKTTLRTIGVLHTHHMDAAAPLFVALLLLTALLWAVSAVAPLAPFVYSLF